MERSHRGLVRWFAKPVKESNPFGGSNPPLSAMNHSLKARVSWHSHTTVPQSTRGIVWLVVHGTIPEFDEWFMPKKFKDTLEFFCPERA